MDEFIVDAETDARVDAKAEEIFAEARAVLGDDIKLDSLSRGLLMGAAFEIVTAENDIDVALQAASKAIALANELSSILNSLMEDGKADKQMLRDVLPITRGFSEAAKLFKAHSALRSSINRKNAGAGILRTPVTRFELKNYRDDFIDRKWRVSGTRTDHGWRTAACGHFNIDRKTLKKILGE